MAGKLSDLASRFKSAVNDQQKRKSQAAKRRADEAAVRRKEEESRLAAARKARQDFLDELAAFGREMGFLDVDMSAFLINSMYVMMIISIVSRHYRIRLGEYLGLTDDQVEEGVKSKIDQVVNIIRFSMEKHPKKLV